MWYEITPFWANDVEKREYHASWLRIRSTKSEVEERLLRVRGNIGPLVQALDADLLASGCKKDGWPWYYNRNLVIWVDEPHYPEDM